MVSSGLGSSRVPHERPLDHAHKLSPQDVTVDSHHSPSMVSVFLCRLKSDPFGMGVTVHIGRTGVIFQDGSSLSRQRLMCQVHHALEQQGVAHPGVSGHSFRIGAATAAVCVGLEDSLIQALGRWSSEAYLRYIRTPPRALAAASASCLSTQSPDVLV